MTETRPGERGEDCTSEPLVSRHDASTVHQVASRYSGESLAAGRRKGTGTWLVVNALKRQRRTERRGRSREQPACAPLVLPSCSLLRAPFLAIAFLSRP